MIDLIKADYYRMRKDIILLISLIIIVAFSLFSPVLFALLKIVASESVAELEAVGMSISFTGKYVFISSLSPSNNLGIILPVLIGVIVCRDFSSGTVRNKLIAGHRKTSIYASHLITALTLGVAFFLFYSLLSLGAGSLLLGYGSVFNGDEVMFILKSLLMGTVIFASTLSLTVFLAALTRSIGIMIAIQIGATILFALLGTIPMMIPNASETLRSLAMLTPAYQITLASSGNIDGQLLAYTLLSSAVYIAISTLLGILIYRKSEQK